MGRENPGLTGMPATGGHVSESREMLDSSMGRLRAIGLAEGYSFLLLLGIAMPLKYFAGLPMAVKIAGWIHGALFILFCVAVAQVKKDHRWSLGQCAYAVVMALIPLGPFFLEARFKREDAAARAPISGA